MLNRRIKRFKTHELTFHRVTVGYLLGRAVEETAIDLGPYDAVVVPASGDDLKVLPEGTHVEGAQKIVVAQPMKAGDTTALFGTTYKVLRVDGPWTLRGSTHYNLIAVKDVKP